MKLSSMMANQVSELRHTLNLGLMKSQMATQTAQVTAMMEDFTKVQKVNNAAPHPTLGSSIDIKA